MSNAPTPASIAATGKKWAAVLGGVAVVLTAIIPPAVTALRQASNVAASGSGVAIGGNVSATTNSSNTNIVQTYFSAWADGAQTLAGADRTARPPAQGSPSPQPTATLGTSNQQASNPEPGALGQLVTNASLMNDASWTVESSRVPRLLRIDLRVEGVPEPDKLGAIDVTLFREGKDVCSVNVNSRTSPRTNQATSDHVSCQDSLVGGRSFTYKARVKATAMTPIKVVLAGVHAVKQ